MAKEITIPTYMKPYKVWVNGREYVYKEGSTVSVPDEVAAVIENIEKNRLKELGYHERPDVPDLNENDPTRLSYVKNRTHYTEPARTVEDKISINWDGDTTRLVWSICNKASFPQFYKVADLPEGMTEADILSLDYTKMTINGSPVTSAQMEILDSSFTGNGTRAFGTSSPQIVMAAYSEASFQCWYFGSGEDMYFPEAGIYFRDAVESFETTFVVNIPEVVHTIDPKYIKDMYCEGTEWSPVMDSIMGKFTNVALNDAYYEYENGGSLKAVINGVDYTDFSQSIGSKGPTIHVTGTDFAFELNMMNSTYSHNADSWEWYKEKTVIHTVPLKYLPAPYMLDATKYGSSAIPAEIGNELLENLLAGVQAYVYDGTGYNPIVRFEVNTNSSGGVTTYALAIYYGKVGSAGVTFTSKYITINDPNA